jgi:hypothetical protein
MTRSDLTDRIMSISAIVAAVAAVLVGAYEARINREYQRISVWPRIQQSDSFMIDQPYERNVTNVGNGPAIIKSVEIRVDGQVRRTWAEVIRALIGKPIPGHITSWLHNGAVIVANKSITTLKIAAGDDARKLWEASQGDRLSIRICYSSLYDESWISETNTEQPTPVASCTSDPAKEFQQ